MSETVNMQVRTAGSGEPLVLLHGLFGQSMNFQGIMRRLLDQFECIALDLRNHGRSPHVADMSYEQMAQDVIDYLQDTATSPVNLMGHSMGGKVAMTVALIAPDLVRKLVVADIAPVSYVHDFEEVIAPLRRLDLTTLASRADADIRLREAIPDAGLRGFLLTNLAREESGWRWRINLPAIDAAMDDLMAFPIFPPAQTYPGDVLFLSGASSNYVAPVHHDACRALFPAAKFRSVADAGHWLHADQPAAFTSALAQFILG